MKQNILVPLVIALFAGLVGGFVGYNSAMRLQAPLSPLAMNSSLPGQPSVTPPVISDSDEETATIGAVKKASPAVVSIIISKELKALRGAAGINPFPDFFEQGSPFDFFFQLPQRQEQTPRGQKSPAPQKQEVGGGSGFIVSPDGLIMTNKHVVVDEEAEYTVVTSDGKEYPATVVARDPMSDIAFVRIKGENLSTLALGDSDKINIGQTVIAIGFALGEYRNTVTKGVISGVGRKVMAGDGYGSSEVIEEALQTDAAINRGNSGGPLLDLQGEVIGINTAVNFSGQLIGFAIPINSAKAALETVQKTGKISRPWLGVRYMLINPVMAKKNTLPMEQGALVIRGEAREDLAVIPGSPADKAGLVENDIILEVDGVKVSEDKPLAKEIAKHKAGETLKIKVLSKGKEKTVNVILEEFPAK